MSREPVGARYRWGVASRVLAAMVGGYAVTALLVSALARLLADGLGVTPATSVFMSAMVAFLIYALLVMWVFRVNSATRAWRGLVWLALPCMLLLALMPASGA